ncbi:major tail protein [Dinoroseobacter phage vB_DshS-R4C]|uniref:Major tail protein n=1 Tax=Dinoroseobacter phage vB_DshS-R4C TaxID=2590919 RepID=A0ACD6BAB4_9CAUD|nr:Chain A, Major tail protein [Dinoroseobacter phage vB_DshS-R4C]8GTB_B Chain B, Major tail protein [Dinoroseobacter phage vB_DshS-R4C]8GTB_C Chain C, Major tail protein [Dinoroseobacter phage vB_DshS-R4C]8GTB_D Chain D, Major tail protein [Dinoroseobacter phage vB_DshS-R4C]8GTB_E Chain E, Major tail protein [Dinoroseobacter phage vB_DshS-R4C]8GTB_F Chain F, Major tail protein [Dinoroseobacter phage vB_DshS-R4C]8GTB_G Chain G, Major tail protein [Dinoroseobacter phage vB_DshS-R4C]8GTB_H Cha
MLKGKDGVVKNASTGDSIGHLQSWALDTQRDEVSGWGMGDDAERAFTTVGRASGNFEVYLDPADPSDDLEPGDLVDLELYPGGESTGSGYRSVAGALILSTAESASKDGIPMLTVNWRTSGALPQKATVS